MYWLDTAILDSTERLCHRFQLATGKTKVWVAVQLTNLSIVMYFVWAGRAPPPPPRRGWPSRCLRRVPGRAESDSLESAAGNLREQRVPSRGQGAEEPETAARRAPAHLVPHAVGVVLSYPILPLYSLSHAAVLLRLSPWIVLTTVVLYVLPCDPLPPCVGKVREWLRGLVHAPAPSTEVRRPVAPP